MQYLGGKSRVAKELARIIAPKGLWWEPFCGGLSMSVQLAKYGPGLISDAHPALIALYQAVRAGWCPPETVTEEEYQAAKALPDSDPLKAFVGFGCSFGGKYFGGYVPDGRIANYSTGPVVRNPVKAATKSLAPLRNCAAESALAACAVEHLDFLELEPCPGFDVIYCDPPYAGTTGYSTGGFDHSLFWARCVQWAQTGARVFVSEYSCLFPSHAEPVWQKKQNVQVGGSGHRTERLYRVLP